MTTKTDYSVRVLMRETGMSEEKSNAFLNWEKKALRVGIIAMIGFFIGYCAGAQNQQEKNTTAASAACVSVWR